MKTLCFSFAHRLIFCLCDRQRRVASITANTSCWLGAFAVSVGEIQSVAARSLVGEFRARRAHPHRAVARRTRPGRQDHLARLQAGYIDRAQQEKQDLISFIDSVRESLISTSFSFTPAQEVINYLNHGQPRDQVKIAGFEYFGHSNRACFMFDYSNNVDSARNRGCTRTS